MSIQQHVFEQFKQIVGEPPAFVVRAPGRVNLIGEHTDYNDGFVLPMAIDRAIWIALRPRADREVIVHSLDFGEEIRFSLDSLTRSEPSPAEYIKGIAWALQEAGYTLKGWEGVIQGDIPIAAGLSSSAAFEMAAARAFSAVSGFVWDAPSMAKLGQKTENQWVGVNSGIMDQMISASGKANHALLIDCRSLETELAPLPPGTVVVVLDTSTRRPPTGLVGTAYNERRQQCEAAARHFGVPALRDISMAEFEARKAELDDVTRRRAKHVITENHRTLRAIDAMKHGDAQAFGDLMYASHISMRDDFEISSDALNAIVECARKHEACYGARMTGGGFAGCAVALVRQEAADDFTRFVAAGYTAETSLTPAIYVCAATNGAEVVSSLA